MTDQPNCACLKISYDPLPTEVQNPVTGKMVKGHMDRWTCDVCGAEYGKKRWHNAVVKQQQQEIAKLRAVVDAADRRDASCLDSGCEEGSHKPWCDHANPAALEETGQ